MNDVYIVVIPLETLRVFTTILVDRNVGLCFLLAIGAGHLHLLRTGGDFLTTGTRVH